MFTIILGTVVETKQMSAKDKLERKKYMGVWRWESVVIAVIMSRFPSTVTRYMDRNSPKSTGCSSGSSEGIMRWNSGPCVRFCASILLGHLVKKKIHWGKRNNEALSTPYIF
jgi:hypothetical protein